MVYKTEKFWVCSFFLFLTAVFQKLAVSSVLSSKKLLRKSARNIFTKRCMEKKPLVIVTDQINGMNNVTLNFISKL